ncbi:MAG TPA: XRE family transcriptional regulator [Piscirickettsiaceae bacterium]|nr:XRE family transcriptional regulator [Piscirickettsiaceae bacterium]HIQ40916.1 XRE family transcriptional regulator [Sulfurivirga caldicuralii]
MAEENFLRERFIEGCLAQEGAGGLLIRSIRSLLGMTQSAFAAQLGISQPVLARIESLVSKGSSKVYGRLYDFMEKHGLKVGYDQSIAKFPTLFIRMSSDLVQEADNEQGGFLLFVPQNVLLEGIANALSEGRRRKDMTERKKEVIQKRLQKVQGKASGESQA